MKRECKTCNKIFPLEMFSLNKNLYLGRCETCKSCRKKLNNLYRKNAPKWVKTYYRILDRCNYKKGISYHKYGGKGVKCLITKDELKYLWFRDKAMDMKRPSIDRIDSCGNYELSNCRYMELSENSRRGGKASGKSRSDSGGVGR